MRIGSRQSHAGWSFAAALSALALLGCGGGYSSSATFAWSIYDITDTGYRTPLSCASVGGGQVVLTLTNQNTGQVYSESAVAPCSAMQATTQSVPSGPYRLGLDLYGDPLVYRNSSTLLDSYDSTDSFYLYAGEDTDYRSPSEVFFTRSLAVRWNIYSRGSQSACAAGETVDLEFFTPGATDWVTSTFDCSTYAGTSYPYPVDADSAQWRMALVDGTGTTDVGAIAGANISLPKNTGVSLGTQSFVLN